MNRSPAAGTILDAGPVTHLMPSTRQPSPDPSTSAPADEAWDAVLERDPRFDGRLVYAVRTTGIYCKPTCPSRRPRRENVTFFDSCDAAEAAGFRACMRCRPRTSQAPRTVRAVERARALIDERAGEPVTLDALAAAVGVSPFHLHRMFTRELGLTPRQYAAARRAEHLKARLKQGDTVSRATYEAGYGSSRGVYESAANLLGMTPGAYRKGGRGMRIVHTIVATSFGRLLVAATERGVCAVSLGDDDAALEDGLRREYPSAEHVAADAPRAEWVAAVARLVEGEALGSRLPVDVAGTAFQRRVWKALTEIPSGETRSYGELAAAIGAPRAARAVARACATNHVAVVVPCHRVVREDGSLGGYRWGADRKARLLARETRET